MELETNKQPVLILEISSSYAALEGLSIYIRTDVGGLIPHFYVMSRCGYKRFYTCIEIEQNNYFRLDGKKGKLNAKQRKCLNEYLHEDFGYDGEGTNWGYMVYVWNRYNPQKQISLDLIQPDYTTIKDI